MTRSFLYTLLGVMAIFIAVAVILTLLKVTVILAVVCAIALALYIAAKVRQVHKKKE